MGFRRRPSRVPTAYRYGGNALALALFLGGIAVIAYFLSQVTVVEIPQDHLGRGKKQVPKLVFFSSEVDDWLEPGVHAVPDETTEIVCTPTGNMEFDFSVVFEPSGDWATWSKALFTEKILEVEGTFAVDASATLSRSLLDEENEPDYDRLFAEPLIESINKAYGAETHSAFGEAVHTSFSQHVQKEYRSQVVSFTLKKPAEAGSKAKNTALISTKNVETQVVKAKQQFSLERFKQVLVQGGLFIVVLFVVFVLFLPGIFGGAIVGGLDIFGIGPGLGDFDIGDLNPFD